MDKVIIFQIVEFKRGLFNTVKDLLLFLYVLNLVVTGVDRENYHNCKDDKDDEADTYLCFYFHSITTMPALTV
jgi:hypothetical protein